MSEPTSAAGSGIQVIDRAVALLDALARHEGGASLKMLGLETALSPSTAFRILAALGEHGLVARDGAGHYLLGARLTQWAARVRVARDVREVARPVMERLRDALGETVNLTVRQGDEVVYVERATSSRMMRVEQVIGSRAPLHVTAVGKLMLGEDGAAALGGYARRTGLPAFTPNTLDSEAKLLPEVQGAVERGYAFDNEEAELGVGCIGALIRDAAGKPVAGLSVSAPRERRRDAWAGQVVAAAREISAALGHRGD
ncbi:MAG: IclR family transcriptional regulator [Pseudomonadota bacterium]